MNTPFRFPTSFIASLVGIAFSAGSFSASAKQVDASYAAEMNPTYAINSIVTTTWEIAYNHFHNRMGFDLPKMAAVLPGNRPTGWNHHMAWETLTHAGLGTIGLPPVVPGTK